MQKRNVKLALVSVATCLCVALCGTALIGCSSVEAGSSPDAPAVMGKGHQGRFETLGAAGCYGCHGYNEQGKSQLTGATVIPLDHMAADADLTDLSVESLSGDHVMCQTCHVQGE